MPSFIFLAIALQSGAVAARPATPAPHPVPGPVAGPAAKPATSLIDVVLQRMTPDGRPILRRYVDQVLQPRLRADGEAERQYRAALRSVAAAPTLDLDAAERLIAQRRQAEATFAGSIRASTFAMIRSLPAADRKLALTAIFADARALPARPAPAPASRPAAKSL